MLATYRDVFTTKCPTCDRVLSPEGYLPPIARVWREAEGGGGGGGGGSQGVWEARHVSCAAPTPAPVPALARREQ
jgi:hypothetical protein